MADNGSSSSAVFPELVPTDVDAVYAAVELLCAMLSVLGNLLVIIVFVKFSVLRTTTNLYVISLAVADLLVGLVGIPSALATSVGLPRHFHACLVMNSILMLLCTSSIFSLLAVTVDRYWAITQPLTYPGRMTRGAALGVVAICWVLAAIIGLLPSMGWNKGPPTTGRCFFMEVMDLRYLVFIFFATILVPSALMAVIYTRIFKAVQSQVRRMSSQMLPGENVRTQHLRAETKAAKSLAIIVVLFVVSWMPLYIFNTIMCFCPTCELPLQLINFGIALSHFNSAWNPALYAWGMRDFKQCLRKLWQSMRKRRFLVTML